MFDYFRRGPSKESLRNMLAEALRNTPVERLARIADPAPQKEPESAPVVAPLLALPAPKARPVPLQTPAIIYLPPPPKPRRDFLNVSSARCADWTETRQERLEPRDRQVARLESTRIVQEAAWYDAGYSREQIIRMFGNWPVNCGYAPYEWTVGYPPVGHVAWRR